MQTWDNNELLAIAQTQINSDQQQRHIELLEKNQTRELTAAERQELSELRKSADIFNVAESLRLVSSALART
jgi:hypothetical protein